MSKLKDLDYENRKISKKGWVTPKLTQYLEWRSPKYYDPDGLYVFQSTEHSLRQKGFVYLDDEILMSKGWDYLDDIQSKNKLTDN